MPNSNSLYNFLFKVVGEDPQLLNKCEPEIRKKFFWSCSILIGIFLCSLIGFYKSFDLIFNYVNDYDVRVERVSKIFVLGVSVFISFMLYNIYKLNLITLSPNKLQYSFGYIISLSFRLLFFIIIGVAISKPLELVVFNPELTSGAKDFISNIRKYNVTHPEIWLITILFLALFTTPFFIKFFINPSNSYSRSKMVLNKKIIEDDYLLFKQRLPTLFEQSMEERIELEEMFEDPPYNTIKKKDDRKIGDVEDFITHLYGV